MMREGVREVNPGSAGSDPGVTFGVYLGAAPFFVCAAGAWGCCRDVALHPRISCTPAISAVDLPCDDAS